ncbi:MAG TPA: hypothetical protein VFX28_21525 [Methylomirabilota bacterium]|nr:hypothetical protein [Methylomirabilota bacterium]
MAERESLARPRLALAFATMLFVSGIGNTFPVFFPPLLDEFGGSRAATASAITVVWVGGAMLGPVAAWAIARWDPRAIVILGLVAAAVASAWEPWRRRSRCSRSPSAWAAGSAWG